MTKNQQILAKIGGGGSLALLLSLGLGQQASALTLVGNLNQSNGGDDGITVSQWRGSSFTTASGSYSLGSATLLFLEESFSSSSSELFVRLYSDNSGVPGTQIASFTNPGSITSTLANNTFTLTTPQALTANTTYWLVSGVSDGGGNFSWGNTYTNSTDTGLPDWTIGSGYAVSNDQASWTYNVGGPYQFSVNGTEQAVPEPLTMLGTGVVLGAIPVLKKEYGKRKKKKDEDA